MRLRNVAKTHFILEVVRKRRATAAAINLKKPLSAACGKRFHPKGGMAAIAVGLKNTFPEVGKGPLSQGWYALSLKKHSCATTQECFYPKGGTAAIAVSLKNDLSERLAEKKWFRYTQGRAHR